MAVVTRYTAAFPQLNTITGWILPNGIWQQRRGNVKAALFSIAATNGDSINSIYKLARVPSGAIILPSSTLYAPAIAGATSVSVGFNNGGGTVLDTALMSAVNISAGGSFNMMSAVTVANYLQPVWSLLGLTSDPNAEIDVELLLNAALTASGVIAGHIQYADIGP